MFEVPAPNPENPTSPELPQSAQSFGHGDLTEAIHTEALRIAAVRLKALTDWHAAIQAAESAKLLITAEQVLRKEVAALFFPTPKEGTNVFKLNDGWELKYTYPITREVDIGALGALKDEFAKLEIVVGDLVEYKPKLVTKEYRTLTEEQVQLFDQALIVKPGSPSLEIVLPAKAKKAGSK